jgi:hypothetical protein
MPMCRPRRGQVTGGLRNLHDEELHNLCSSANITMEIKMEMCTACSTQRHMRNP